MLAIRRNRITCAHRRCPLIGSVLISHQEPAVTVAATGETYPRPVVELEYCPRHATDILAERAARAAHPAGVAR
jgi:hypothetical protein